MGVLGGVAPKNFGTKNCVYSLTTLHKNWILMCCGLGEEERTKLKKKKKEKKGIERKKTKKERKKPHHRQKCIDWDKRVS